MRIVVLFAALLLASASARAIEDNTVEIAYSGSTAKVTVASNIKSYVSVTSGTSSHVKIVQSESFAGVDATDENEDGEIIYVLSGSSTDGEFYMEGSFKATVELNGLTLTNPTGAAIAIMDGKRVSVSVKKGTTNTLTDGANETYNGCFHCKGHTKFKGKGTLTVVGNSKHAIYSKEYLEVKNCALKVTKAAKDGIHCKEYFLQESGSIAISGVADDGIQVEISGTTSTGTMAGHEEEDSGNFYQDAGTLTIKDFGGSAIKADGSVKLSGTMSGFSLSDVSEYSSGIYSVLNDNNGRKTYYDLNGRQLPSADALHKGVILQKQNGETKKAIVK